ncbi:putative olfactory receptor 10D4 [Camelus dromedarius]|uniref:Putative olfactory receptor 10D4 n=1 Tax=Camelus dromedarius TaxID=9838 RepID=A0A5N4C897_CAMDR|nr:putative olfactory receptor 10D4 [Camelus dromedarius]
MEVKNHTSVKEFTLSGIPHAEGQQTVPSVVFLTFHLCALLGNPLILVAVMFDSCLHTPMYFFLCNLSVLDIGFSAVSTPKTFANLLVKNRVISLGGCASQVFCCHFLGCSECQLYTVMA